MWNDISLHRSGYVDVNSIQLNYLDWGGDNTPLILIHGIGDNAHIFDDLAMLLRDRFRVLAYSRRGHGHSGAPERPYDQATLVSDLREFMDVLKIERAHLLGWSMGGNEITQFAGQYPERANKLIYLDSGYDWADSTFFKTFGDILAAHGPDQSHLRSLDQYRAWYRNFWFGDIPWTAGLESYLRDATRVEADRKIQTIPTETVFPPLFESLAGPPRNYLAVRSPALALYASIFFPARQNDPLRETQLTNWERDVMIPFRQSSIDRVLRELPNVVVKRIAETCHMSIGVYKTESLAATILSFLA